MKKLFSILVCALAAMYLLAEAPIVMFSVTPQILFPVSPEDEEGDVLYGMGGGASLASVISPRSLRWLSGIIEAGFDYLPTNVTDDSLSLIRLGAGVGVGYQGSKFGARLTGSGGYYYGFYGNTGGGNLYYDGGVQCSYRINEAFTLSLLGGWRDYLSLADSSETFLVRTPYAGLSLALEPAAFRASGLLTIDDVRISPVFPTLMKYYTSNALGTLVFTNKEAFEVTDIEISFFVPAYMDRPTVVARYPSVKRNETITVDLSAVFNPKILSVTEGAIAQSEVQVEYKLSDRSSRVKQTQDLTIYDRGALSWDDDRKAAVFITTKDQALLTFAKNTFANTEAIKGLIGERSLRAAAGNNAIMVVPKPDICGRIICGKPIACGLPLWCPAPISCNHKIIDESNPCLFKLDNCIKFDG